ncbi:MAG TPA: BTAD domain-containing putative transcriptional regulator, partial [Roseiflexaceae bacterium]|nr:BTAD domain-containing putative transcriptional regulator [Roseiflexaceae bacterium]
MLRLCLFGDPEIYYGGAPVASLHSLKSRALLYYLAMTGRPQPRLALAGLFWGEKRDNQALVSLRQALHQLRIVLPDCIDTNRTYAAINPAQLLEIDALVFAEHAIAGLAGDLTALRAAADAYRGDFLANLYVNDAPDFEVWVLQERESLRGLAFQCLRKLAAHAVAHRMIAAGLGYARRLLALDPLLEDTHRQLMQLLAWDGQISAALDQYDRCRRILDDELSMTPSAETTALYKRIRSVALTQTEQPAPPELHAPLQPAHYHHLPRRTTSFVDRKREIAELLRLLRPLPVSGPAHVRLVTLVGSGGVGKTRLSTEAASLLAAEFSDGIVLVELATLADQRQLPIVIAAALGMPIQARLPLPDQLVAYLRDKHLLLLLDSCEHLIDDTAQIVDMLLRAAPDLKILATSREALLVEGEMRYPVLPLVTPDPLQIVNSEQLMSYASVRLLCDRITAVQPDFAITDSLVLPIAQICQQLDGLPLAIELAAARADSLSIAQIAARVDDLFPRPAHNLGGQDTRHQSLDALIEWSTARLSAAECLLFFRLAVFAGGWTIDACEAICADTAAGGIEQPLVLTLLMSLVDTSLVLLDADTAVPRYRLLETVRRYAAKQLRAAGEEQALHQRHLHFYCAQSEVAASHQITPNHQQWLEWLETECANLQQALIWARHADPATALRMAQALADLRHAQPPLDEHGIPLQQVIDETLAWLTNTSQSHIGTPSSIRQLPVQLTTFIDRPTELAEIQRLMQQSRIITLTGPGGVGKTRLALHAAAQLRDQFADGVCFVDFTALTDPALVPQTVMAALGLRVQPGRSVDDTLCDYLAGRSLLLLLDNCEHLLSACEALVTQLLAVAPALHVLATSRQAIKHPAARRAVIPPLVVPDPRQQQSLAVLMNYSVIQLFLDRATAVQPMFQLTEATAAAIVRICHHLDGLPLAIELAAARISSLPIDLIADRLSARLQLLTNGRRGTPPHHQ